MLLTCSLSPPTMPCRNLLCKNFFGVIEVWSQTDTPRARRNPGSVFLYGLLGGRLTAYTLEVDEFLAALAASFKQES